MSGITPRPTPHPVLRDAAAAEELAQRCSDLGLPAWVLGRGGELLKSPVVPVPDSLAARWLTNEELFEQVRHAATLCARTNAARMERLFAGAHVILLPHQRGDHPEWVVAAVSLTEAAMNSDEARDFCRREGVELASLHESCRGVMRTSESGTVRVLRILEWMRDDLIAKARNTVAIAEFSTQLSEMYEEIGLLYRVGRSMNRVTQPEDFVRETCNDLARTLPFGWVALKFMPSVRVAIGLSGRLFIAGKPPCAPEELDTLLFETLLDLPSDRWALMTPEDGRRLARRVNSQVLAHPVTREQQVIGALFAGNKHDEDPHVSSFETQLLDAAADYMGVFIENAALYSDQHSLFLGMVEALTASIDAKDRYTCGHSERVGLMAAALASALGMKPEEAERIRIAGLLHDVGKIGVPEAVLTKPGRLTEAEFEQMKRHPAIGHRILRDMPSLEDILPGVLHHHERWDGGGYPNGLAGDDIPYIARLLGVADAFDAMSSTRSYRAAMPRQKVLSEVLRCAGQQFDPEMARAFVQLDMTEYDRLASRHLDRERNPDARAA